MKILHINKFFDTRGGVEVYLHQLMAHQSASGHDVHALSTRADENAPSKDAPYFIHRFDFSRSDGWKEDARKAGAYMWNTAARDATKKIIKDIHPDVIHLHNIYHHLSSSILGPIRESGIRCVQTLHDLKLGCPNYSMFTEGSVCERCKGGKYWNAIEHHCLTKLHGGNVLAAAEMAFTKTTQSYEKTVHTFITPSTFYRDKLVEWGEPANKFVVIRNPAEVSAVPAKDGGGYVLFVGRLSKEKGVDVLIRAAAKVPSLIVKIAGRGPEEAKLRELARSLGAANVSFLGFVPWDNLIPLRDCAEALVVPSVWYENCPLVVLEALGQGLPVLASHIGGIPELIDDGEDGWLVTPGDVNAWAEALHRVLRVSPSDRACMGERGRERIRIRHGWKEHGEKLEEVYKGRGA